MKGLGQYLGNAGAEILVIVIGRGRNLYLLISRKPGSALGCLHGYSTLDWLYDKNIARLNTLHNIVRIA